MHMSLSTLYAIGLGTLTMAAAMTLWERRFHAGRSQALTFWAGGFASLVVGCALLILRDTLPRLVGFGFANLFIIGGYVLLLAGSLPFAGLRLPRFLVGFLLALAPVWLVIGPTLPDATWHALSGLLVALCCLALALVFAKFRPAAAVRTDRLVVTVFGLHGLVYLLRVPVIPLLAWQGREAALDLAALITMFEGVLFSMAAPMALLSLAREENRVELQHASETDFLTGLDNRRAFFAKAEAMVQAPAQLVLFDLDHFKSINDRHGHETGDEVLRIFARVAKERFGADDLVARVGGEEFAALLPGAGPDDAISALNAIAWRLRREARAGTRLTQDVTFSAGLASLPAGASLTAGLNMADRLLYQAKTKGRNRIEREAASSSFAPADTETSAA
ncbi:hypothetical protein BJF93_08960 [Xaviernesmea oryzae]|uniref:diguanylate cyclase n=2 Tax=Xaviernesmea oryzae TaxID=464029 RepID=A0A1Q9B154_9HYPH|nr:hypothetical protein BJF93_08960 [Xaviernesmea oryzae]